MKTSRLLLLLRGLFVIMAFNACQKGTADFEGKIIDSFTKKPIPDVMIAINGEDPRLKTDSTGSFILREMKSGTISVTFRKEGFRSVTVPDVELKDSMNTYLKIDLTPVISWIPALTSNEKIVYKEDALSYWMTPKSFGGSDFYSEDGSAASGIPVAKVKRAAAARAAAAAKAASGRGVLGSGGTVGGGGKYAAIDIGGSENETITMGASVVGRKPKKTYFDTFFKRYNTNPFIDTKDEPVSTFGADASTASFSKARNYINDFNFPPFGAVRVEEFINYFPYKYPIPNEKTVLQDKALRRSETEWIV